MKLCRKSTHNTPFAESEVSYFYEIEALNSRFVHLIKFSP